MTDIAAAWRWIEAKVDRTAAHFELRYGSADHDGWHDWLPVALVGRPSLRAFLVEFLISAGDRDDYSNIIALARRELDFYLVELGEPNPWGYARYHCGTTANAYSSIHWSYFPGPPVDLFWDTRRLTKMREDHLTCFLAAALENDARFRSAYEDCVLSQLADVATDASIVPSIQEVEVQPHFKETGRRPDLRLWLSDGRQVICEHKLEAPEGKEVDEDDEEGDVKRQLDEYLALPVDAVAYFRASIASSADTYVRSATDARNAGRQARYLHPSSAPHFLWRDLFDALSAGQDPITRSLFEGFKRLGFTPPLIHVGKLWPDGPDEIREVRERQQNFGKLWHKTQAHLSTRWKVKTGLHGCELHLRPTSPAAVVRVYISPIAQGGSLLRFRAAVTDQAQSLEVRRRLDAVVARLPVAPDVVEGDLFLDLLAPLHLLLGSADTPEQQGEILFRQVTPMVDALLDPV